MGAHESTQLQMDFNHPSLSYFAGEQIAGNISFQNTQDKLTLDEIFVEFVGELGYTTRESRIERDSNNVARTEYYTKYHQLPFMNVRIPIVQPKNGQRDVNLTRGQHSWPFEYVLPHTLAPSIIGADSSRPYVKYYTRVVLDKSWYKPNAKQVYPLTIFPHVNLLHVPGGQQPVAFSNQNRKSTRLQGQILQGGLVPGGKLSIQLELYNPDRAEIKRIETVLTQHQQVAQGHHDEVIFRMDIPDLCDFNGPELRRTFELRLPSVALAPSYQFMAPCSYQMHPVIIYYELELKVKARGMFTDFEVKIPVIIGTEPASDQKPQHQQMNSSVEMPTASAPINRYEDLPPTYEAAVRNEKM